MKEFFKTILSGSAQLLLMLLACMAVVLSAVAWECFWFEKFPGPAGKMIGIGSIIGPFFLWAAYHIGKVTK